MHAAAAMTPVAIQLNTSESFEGATRIGVAAAKKKHRSGDQGEHQPLSVAADDDEGSRLAKGEIEQERQQGVDDAEESGQAFAISDRAGASLAIARKSAVSRLFAAVAT